MKPGNPVPAVQTDMPRTDVVLNRLREICLALPETKETITWGQTAFSSR